jgi:hypothetical protein
MCDGMRGHRRGGGHSVEGEVGNVMLLLLLPNAAQPSSVAQAPCTSARMPGVLVHPDQGCRRKALHPCARVKGEEDHHHPGWFSLKPKR